MTMMWTGYYVSHAKSARNRKVWVLLNHHADWDSTSLRVRGIMYGMVWQRPSTPLEIDAVNRSHRAMGYKYDDLDGLLEDEAASGATVSQIDSLKQILLVRAMHIFGLKKGELP